MKTCILIASWAPAVVWLAEFAQAINAGLPTVDFIQGASSITFAGLVFFMLAVRAPKRDKENRDEREKFLTGLQDVMSEHREERDQWKETLDKVSGRSRESAKDGHRSASELSRQLQRLVDSQPS